jgi:hypothetical protein
LRLRVGTVGILQAGHTLLCGRIAHRAFGASAATIRRRHATLAGDTAGARCTGRDGALRVLSAVCRTHRCFRWLFRQYRLARFRWAGFVAARLVSAFLCAFRKYWGFFSHFADTIGH